MSYTSCDYRDDATAFVEEYGAYRPVVEVPFSFGSFNSSEKFYVLGDLSVGTYVDYRPDGLDSDKSYTSLKSINGYEDQVIKQENLKWRILSVNNDDNTVTLISERPTWYTIKYEPDQSTSLDCTKDLNNICKYLYSSGDYVARSLEFSDFSTQKISR